MSPINPKQMIDALYALDTLDNKQKKDIINIILGIIEKKTNKKTKTPILAKNCHAFMGRIITCSTPISWSCIA